MARRTYSYKKSVKDALRSLAEMAGFKVKEKKGARQTDIVGYPGGLFSIRGNDRRERAMAHIIIYLKGNGVDKEELGAILADCGMTKVNPSVAPWAEDEIVSVIK